MTIYAKKLNGKQRAALQRMEQVSGVEPLYQDEIDSGEMKFKEVWSLNIQWLEDMVSDVSNTNLRGC